MQLSGGQWQRVALARAAMRPDARLFILDEPSASLDPLAEADQRDRLRALLAGTTGLLISHRLDSICRAGLIVVLRDGNIAEQGTHDALMRSDGEYARLFRIQAQGFLNPSTSPLPLALPTPGRRFASFGHCAPVFAARRRLHRPVACIVARGAAGGTRQLISGITLLAVWCYLRWILAMIPFCVSDTEGAGKHALWSESA